MADNNQNGQTGAKELWEKVKGGARIVGDKMTAVGGKISVAVTSAVNSATNVISENFGAEAKKAKKINALFEANATVMSLELESEYDVKNTIYAVVNAQEKTLIIRADDDVKNLQIYSLNYGKIIILLGEKTFFDYDISVNDEQVSVSCYTASYTPAFSSRLSAAKQALISKSIAKLDAVIGAYTPSFFRRKKFSQLSATYEAYKKSVLSDSADETQYATLNELIKTILPQSLETLNAIHMQLI